MIPYNIFYYDGVPKKYLNIKEQTCSNTGQKVLVAKYSKKAFFEQAWNEYPALLQARGHIFDVHGRLLSLPFEKVFNYSENGAGLNIDPETRVSIVRKMNGFFAATTMTRYGLMIQTSGSVQDTNIDGSPNEYYRMAKEMILALPESAKQYVYLLGRHTSMTLMFEVCHPDDPHIVVEEPGLYLIGTSYMGANHIPDPDQRRFYMGEFLLDRAAQKYGFKRIPSLTMTYSDALDLAKHPSCSHEGYMIREYISGKYICKVKSRHYLSRKVLARATTPGKLEAVQNPDHPQYDEEIVEILSSLKQRGVSVEDFISMDEQERLKLVRDVF